MRGPELVLDKEENKKQDRLVQTFVSADLPPKNNKPEQEYYRDLNGIVNDECNWIVVKYLKTLDGFYNMVLVKSSSQQKINAVSKKRVCITCMFENGEVTHVKVLEGKGILFEDKKEILATIKSHILKQEKEQELSNDLNNVD